MKRLIILVCYVSLMSCQDRVICPAFQSTYILDDSTRNAYFSYVWQLDENTRNQYLAQQKGGDPNDTLGVVAQPKTDYYAYAGEKVVPWRVQKQTKYGIIKHTPYPIKKYQLRTAPMENVLSPEPVSNDFVAADFGVDSLSLVADSLRSDTLTTQPVAAVEEDKPRYLYGYDPSDNFNVEQEYYNKYFGYKFIDKRPKPTPKPVMLDSLGNPVLETDQTKTPFFKGLFKKKQKGDSTNALQEPIELPTPAPTNEEGTEEENGNG